MLVAPRGVHGSRKWPDLPMNEHLESELISVLKAQTKAINRLADSNEALVAIIYQTYLSESEADLPAQMYLSGKAQG